VGAGAEALTLVNTVMGMAIDVESRRPVLGAGGGGLSGAAIRPVAVRAVYECRQALPKVPIVGVGGVRTGGDAVELLMAGADAVQVGTATFFEPRAPLRVVEELERWCRRHRVTHVRDLRGAVHG
jgi:dihydroorotate dehydrogenase (NAD+) catalytic subunit